MSDEPVETTAQYIRRLCEENQELRERLEKSESTLAGLRRVHGETIARYTALREGLADVAERFGKGYCEYAQCNQAFTSLRTLMGSSKAGSA